MKYARVAGSSLPLVKMEFTTARVDARGNVTKLPGQSAMGFVEDLGNGVKLEMVEIAGGRFLMGSPESEAGRSDDEKQHEVTVSDFYIGRYEMTQQQWKAVTGGLPPTIGDLSSDFKGNGLPVVRVSWDEAKEFISLLNQKLGLSDKDGYRLPSEAQWEYAARAGTTTPFSFGATIMSEVVNYNGNLPYGQAPKGKYVAHPVVVGTYPANGFGLFDMHGNVWEWCEDWYDEYPSSAVTNPTGPATGSYRVIRGGGWDYLAVFCRSANRNHVAPGNRYDYVSFRLVRVGR